MPEDQAFESPKSIARRAEFGFGGILVGIVVLTLIFVVLNYFNLIRLPFGFFQKTGEMPSNNSQFLPQGQKISPTLEAEAKTAGYSIIWQGDQNDMVGRTILASDKRKDFLEINDKFGWVECSKDVYVKDVCRGQGVFDHLEKINNSNDYYIFLTNPIDGTLIKSRILVGESTQKDLNNYPTRLTVDDLNFLPITREGYTVKDYGVFDNKLIERFNSVIKKGDILTVYTRSVSKEIIEKPNNKLSSQRDKFNILIASNIFIRRFGGLIKIN